MKIFFKDLFTLIKTNDKLPFARCANCKCIKEDHLGFHFQFDSSVYMQFCFQDIYICKMKLAENGNFHLFAANRKWNWQTSISLLQRKKEVCFPWSANNKR
jgi:hypothetical protein